MKQGRSAVYSLRMQQHERMRIGGSLRIHPLRPLPSHHSRRHMLMPRYGHHLAQVLYQRSNSDTSSTDTPHRSGTQVLMPSLLLKLAASVLPRCATDIAYTHSRLRVVDGYMKIDIAYQLPKMSSGFPSPLYTDDPTGRRKPYPEVNKLPLSTLNMTVYQYKLLLLHTPHTIKWLTTDSAVRWRLNHGCTSVLSLAVQEVCVHCRALY